MGTSMSASEAQAELAALLREFSARLEALASMLGAAPSAAPPSAQAPAFRVPAGVSALLSRAGLERVPATTQEAFMSLAQVLAVGVKERPYDGHSYFIAAEPLNATGNDTDIGRTVDFLMILPSIDAQIDFDDQPIKQSTPTVSGGTILKHPVRSRVIHHKAVSTTLKGTLSVFAYWWNG
jgi:hypothetical protein